MWLGLLLICLLVHDIGEIWATVLIEVYAALVGQS